MNRQLLILLCCMATVFSRELYYSQISSLLNQLSLGSGKAVDDTSGICNSEQCKIAADFISKGMNKSANPCENFYKYACGGWPINFPVPPKESEWNIDEIVQKSINDMRKQILEEEIKPSDTVPLQFEKRFYKSCMNLDAIEKTGIKPLINSLNAIGGWPLITPNWDSKTYTWQLVHDYYANLTGTHTLFSVEIDADMINSTVNILIVDQPDENLFSRISVPTENIDNLISNYTDLIISVTKTISTELNITLDKKNVVNDLKNLWKFGFQIINILSEEEARQDFERMMNYMSISDLQKLYNKNVQQNKYTSKIDWLETLRHFFADLNITISESDTIMVREPQYLSQLALLLRKTPDRTIVNYIHWMYIMKILPYTTQSLCDKAITLYHMITDPKNFPDRWEICLALNLVEVGTSYEFVKKNMSDNTIKEVRNVAENVRKQLANQIESSNWLNQDLKMKNVDKVNNMEVRIAYPEWYNNLTVFNHHLDGLYVGDDFFANALAAMAYFKKKELQNLRKPVDKNEWIFEPTVSNAYYLHSSNSLTILAAEITLPIFDPSLPKSVNYGSIGFISGHEMSHGFDSNGHKFTKEGNLIPWWPKEMENTYNERIKCFVDQFNNYSSNGVLTSNENVADNIGLVASFNAYKTVINDKQDQKLPGLEYLTSDQLFFLSFASNFCTTTKEQVDENNDVHSLPPERINGAVANMDSFNQAFQCKKTASKCSIWK